MTEIFGSLGPACAQTDILEKMFLEGMTGMRLNLSHSGLSESRQVIRNFQKAAQRTGAAAELLIDLQGPEVRIGALRCPIQLKEAEEAVFAAAADAEYVNGVIPVSDQVLAAFETGDRVLLDDGKMELVITSAGRQVTARVLCGGLLQQKKSLKIADKQIPGPVLTKQDMENISLAKDYGVTALMQPFVTSGEQLLQIRRELKKRHLEHIRIFAKIENREGMERIRDILPFADMIVIARGDLGNDMPLWELPAAQKRLSEICKSAGKPFLIVTQLLASMVNSPYPTRAEVSDIFHAVQDGAAAVMVTNETAVGKYPAEVIRYLKQTVREAENYAAALLLQSPESISCPDAGAETVPPADSKNF